MKAEGTVTMSLEEYLELWMKAHKQPDSVRALAESVAELHARVASLEPPKETPKMKWDRGKVMALYDAGWSTDRIVEDLAPLARRDTACIHVRKIIREELDKRETAGISEAGGEDD